MNFLRPILCVIRAVGLIVAFIALAAFWHGSASVPQKPGFSAALFAAPYYSCTRNFYVGPTGNNSSAGTSLGTLWLTIANYEVKETSAGGDCINVVAGTYAAGNSALAKGGTSAAANGYVTYRCIMPSGVSGSGCIITGANAFAAGNTFGGNFPSYLIFDGFNLDNPDLTDTFDDGVVCVGSSGGTNPTVSPGCHHWMVLNSHISGHGQGGVGSQGTEYWTISHTIITQNAHQCTSGVYGSGIGLVVSAPVSGYSLTADDTNANNNAALNLIGRQGPNFSDHNLVAYNIIWNNYQGCGPPNSAGFTDGNGVIVDTNEIGGIGGCNTGGVVNYSGGFSVGFNIIYNNGGAGLRTFTSSFVTAYNNSFYNNGLDPQQEPNTRASGAGTQCGTSNGFGAGSNKWLNNVSYSLPASSGTNNTANDAFEYGGNGTAVDVVFNAPYGHNISIAPSGNIHGSSPNANGIAPFQNPPNANWSCTDNKCNVDPLWISIGGIGGGTAGDQTTPPSSTNFGLQGTSPAIASAITNATYSFLPPWAKDAGACDHSFAGCGQ